MSELRIESIPFESSYQKQPVAGYLFYDPTVQPHAILQLSHGMAEYILRYKDFAAWLVQQGYVVCGNDHLGHGRTSGTDYPDGFFAPEKGADHVLNDLHTLNTLVRRRYPGLPLVLFGHSMGSFFARWFVETWPEAVDAAVFCGTAGENPAAPAGLALSRLIWKLKGPMHRSRLCYKAAFGAYNKRIEAPQSGNAWLSVEPENVARYDADPKCGFMFTVSAFHEMLRVMAHVNEPAWAQTVRKDLPVLVIAGGEDPVGDYGKGPAQVAQRLQAAGVQRVTLKLYDGLRHEILNEACRAQVYADVFAWCESALNGAPRAEKV